MGGGWEGDRWVGKLMSKGVGKLMSKGVVASEWVGKWVGGQASGLVGRRNDMDRQTSKRVIRYIHCVERKITYIKYNIIIN